MKHLLTLCIGFFMLLSCNNKPSQSAAIATDEPEVNEDTLFRVIDLANNLKPCSDLTGEVNEDAIVVETIDDLEHIDFTRPIYLLSQTTQSLALFEQIKAIILDRAHDKKQVVVNDTICRQVSNRNPHLKEFASRFDSVIFVCGKKSSNGKVLFHICQEANPRCYNIEDEFELRKEWFDGCRSVGICGATSTPKWLMQRVADAIRKMVE